MWFSPGPFFCRQCDQASDNKAHTHLTRRLAGGSLEVQQGGPMIKSELIMRVAEKFPHLYQRDVELIVNRLLDEIGDAMGRDDRVELRGFGTFSVKHRDARIGRNPRTGETVAVAKKQAPFFKTGKDLRDRMNKTDG